MGSLGFSEIILIGIVALIAFGGKDLPGAARRAGRVARQFRDIVDSAKREMSDAVEEPLRRRIEGPKPPEPPAA